MPRVSREVLFNEGNTFHVLVQGIARSAIFDLDKDKSIYLNYLYRGIRQFGISLLAYCVMGNHAHLLISADNKENISKCFYAVNKAYAQYYNAERRRVGYVFRDRFRAEVIDGEDYLVDCISYIHNNPVKAGMVGSALEYEFSSCKSYGTHKGIVDFVRLEGLISGIPEETISAADFFEDEYESKVDFAKAIEETMQELDIKDTKNLDEKTIALFVKTVQSKTKVSLREMAEFLDINREILRKLISKKK